MLSVILQAKGAGLVRLCSAGDVTSTAQQQTLQVISLLSRCQDPVTLSLSPHLAPFLQEMEKSPANHFLILMRDSSCQFRGIYTLDGQSDEMRRLCGTGPRTVQQSAVEAVYKYSSDRKQFGTLPTRTVSMSVDAFTIPTHLWQTKRPTTPKKTAIPK